MDNKEEKYALEDFRKNSLLELSFFQTESLLKKEYISCLKDCKVVNVLDSEELPTLDNITNRYRFFDITKLVYSKEESFLEKILTIVNSIYVCDASLVSMIISDGEKTRFLLGVLDKKTSSDIDTYGQSLAGVIKGNFPGSTISVSKDISEITKSFDEYKIISSISNIPSARNENQNITEYVQGMENLINALGNRQYCILTIADSIPLIDCNIVRASLKELYKQLSGFAKTEISINENYTYSSSETKTDSFSKTIGTNSSYSQSITNQTGWSKGTSQSTIGSVIAPIVGGAAAVGLAVLTGGASAPPTMALLAASGGLVAAGGAIGGAFGSKNQNTSGGQQINEGSQNGHHIDEQNGVQLSEASSIAEGSGKTLSFEIENKTVRSILDEIDKQLERIDKCVNYGAYSSCTYILSKDQTANMMASNMFNALISGENSGIQNPKVNIWDSGNTDQGEQVNVEHIREYLKRFTHPLFIPREDTEEKDDKGNNVVYSPASLINGRELSIELGFPKKSIKGLTVAYKVPFGRNIIRYNTIERGVNIGHIYHMGEIDTGSVELDLDSLTSHVFISGSTGTGKTNTIYKLLEKVNEIDKNIHFMVIEPVKGEYKNAFFRHPSIEVRILGTNPDCMELLRINPFSFPNNVHVLEHIDRLVELFNVCWPMYAAMPAILKNAIIKAYERCGWDVINSYIPQEKKYYPCFADVLSCINEILEESAFSQENKGDYVGALCTRVESLTVGLFSLIFSNDEISNVDLFDHNVIVDLSRVGAVDTKSLLMGILTMKLQEYRMSEVMKPNQRLRHITVLEEAHNLLKKTTTEQVMESSNLVGKSVEMITNAIAEMRTYGESFFIVDQAPELLDRAVIRNTNTKIILRLPYNEDRELVGHSMALNDDQILELSKLERGCAVIYQNDWEEAVLCQIEKYNTQSNDEDDLYVYERKDRILSQSVIKKKLLIYLLDSVLDKESSLDQEKADNCRALLRNAQISIDIKRSIENVLRTNKHNTLKDISGIAVGLYNNQGIMEKNKNATNVSEWNEKTLSSIDPELRKMSKYYMDVFMQCIIIEQTKLDPKFKVYAEKWIREMKGGV